MKAEMEIRELIGQKLVGGFPSMELSEEFIRAVREYKIGNVILFRENIRDRAKLKALCADIQTLVRAETGHPAFIMIDQEGGMVCRLPEERGNIPGAMALASTGDPENAYRAGLLTGQELKRLGVNFDLAPVLDINSNPDNPIIGVRSYGENAETVIRYGLRMFAGLKDSGILSCAKHFPGHGDVSTDSHLGLPCLEKTEAELMRQELLPFAEAVRAGIPAIMTAHILFPAIERERVPATMSRRILTGILREKLGFEGLIVSDCLEMQAISRFYGTAAGGVAAAQAGVDLVMVSHSADRLMETAEALRQAVERGELPEETLRESVSRILRMKAAYEIGEEDGSAADLPENLQICAECDILRTKTVSLVRAGECGEACPALGEAPLFVGPAPYRAGLVGNVREDVQASFPELLRGRLGGQCLVIGADPTGEEGERAKALAAQATAVIFCSYNSHLHPSQQSLMEQLLCDAGTAVAVALRDPYDLRGLPDRVRQYAVYEYTTPMAELMAKVLRGDGG